MFRSVRKRTGARKAEEEQDRGSGRMDALTDIIHGRDGTVCEACWIMSKFITIFSLAVLWYIVQLSGARKTTPKP